MNRVIVNKILLTQHDSESTYHNELRRSYSIAIDKQSIL